MKTISEAFKQFEAAVNLAKVERQAIRRKYAHYPRPCHPKIAWCGEQPNTEEEAQFRRELVTDWESDWGPERSFKLSRELKRLLTVER